MCLGIKVILNFVSEEIDGDFKLDSSCVCVCTKEYSEPFTRDNIQNVHATKRSGGMEGKALPRGAERQQQQ